MSSLTLIGAHRAVSSLLETRPKSWDVVRFKGLFERLDQRNRDLTYEMLSLRSTGEVVARADMGGRQEPDQSSLPKYLVAEVDDLVVNPMWLIGGGIGVSRRAGAVSPDYRVFRSRGALLPRFTHYLVRSKPYLDQYMLYTRAQTTFDRRVQQPDLDNMPLPVPPLEVQRTITDYLDRETARIDTLIKEQQRLIATLCERRQAVIDGQIRELDEAPGVPLRRLVTVPIDAGVDEAGDPSNSAAWPRFVRTTDISNLTSLDPVKRVTISPAAAAPALLQRNDLVATRAGATIGKTYIHISDEIACYAGYLVRIRPNVNLIDPMYLAFWSQSRHYLDQVAVGAVKSTIENYSAAKYRATRVPLPKLSDQQRVSAYLEKQTRKIDMLIAEAERFIGLSQERRSALVTAAVTGLVDVREMV